MEHRSSVQLLSFALFSFLHFRAHALPALGTYSAMSNNALEDKMPDKRQADDMFADDMFADEYNGLREKKAAMKFLDSVLKLQQSDSALEDQMPDELQADAMFTDKYPRLQRQNAIKSDRAFEDQMPSKLQADKPPRLQRQNAIKRKGEMKPANPQDDPDLNDPPFSENYNDITVEDLLNNLPLNL